MKPWLGSSSPSRRVQLDLLAGRVDQSVGQRVEVQPAGQGQGGHDLGRGDEAVRAGVGVVAAGEVAVEAVDDAVLLALCHVGAPPLADARAAGVGHDAGAHGLQDAQLAVALHGGADLLGAGVDQELHLGGQPLGHGLAGHVGRAAHVLVGGVGAGADQRGRQLDRIVLLGQLSLEGRDRPIQVGRIGADDVRLQRAQVDLDHPVVVALRVGLDLGVGLQVLGDLLGQAGHIGPLGGPQIGRHARVEGEERGGGADLRAHVADGALAGGADGARAGAEVLDDGAGAALDGQDAGHLEDHVLGRGPAVELAGQLDADHGRPAQLPGHAHHHVDRVRAADADGHHAQPAGVGGVAVGADHHAAGEGVVLQHHLVDDARARLPEAHAVALARAQQEVVDLGVLVDRDGQVALDAELGADQVVGVDRAGHSRVVAAGQHELQDRHLRGGVLHGHAVRVEVHVALAAHRRRSRLAVHVGQQNLLGQRQRPAHQPAARRYPLRQSGILAA